MPHPNGTATPVSLSEDTQNVLLQAGANDQLAWILTGQGVSMALDENPDAPVMEVYEQCAARSRFKKNTIRIYWSVYRDVANVSADLFDEFPNFSRQHWQTLITYARGNGGVEHLPELAAKWAATSDDFGGLAIAPDTLAGKLNDPKPERSDWEKAIDAAQRAAARLVRHAPDEQTRARMQRLAKAIEKIGVEQ